MPERLIYLLPTGAWVLLVPLCFALLVFTWVFVLLRNRYVENITLKGLGISIQLSVVPSTHGANETLGREESK